MTLAPTARLAVPLLLACALVPAPTWGQALDGRVAAGGVWTSRLASAVGTLTGPFGAPLPVTAELRAEDALVIGAALAWRASPRLEVRLDLSHAATSMALEAVVHGAEGGPPLRTYHFRDQGDVRLWWAGAGAAWRLRGGGWSRPRLDPWVLLQAGATHWDMDGFEELPEISAVTGDSVGVDPVSATLPAAAVGVGLDVRMSGRVAAWLELVDVIGADPLEDEDFHLGSRFVGTVAPDDLVHSVRLVAGVRVALRDR
ncbi:MAG TPA: hypothetical protein VMK65_10310 [Longimicrobiales bacterium]|nr:hypothetical protein [Longimicrobiales bacterium]